MNRASATSGTPLSVPPSVLYTYGSTRGKRKRSRNNGQNLPNILKTSPKCALICTSKKLNKLQVGNAKRSTPRHVTVKLSKAKERILKEKNDFVYKESSHQKPQRPEGSWRTYLVEGYTALDDILLFK